MISKFEANQAKENSQTNIDEFNQIIMRTDSPQWMAVSTSLKSNKMQKAFVICEMTCDDICSTKKCSDYCYNDECQCHDKDAEVDEDGCEDSYSMMDKPNGDVIEKRDSFSEDEKKMKDNPAKRVS